MAGLVNTGNAAGGCIVTMFVYLDHTIVFAINSLVVSQEGNYSVKPHHYSLNYPLLKTLRKSYLYRHSGFHGHLVPNGLKVIFCQLIVHNKSTYPNI